MMIQKLCFVFCLFLSACSGTGSDLKEWMCPNGKIKVLSTTAMIDDIVGQVSGDRVDHIPLIVGEIDPHSYELIKGDDEKLSAAQVIFYNGLGLEHGASLRYALSHHPCAVALGEYIQKQAPELILYVDRDVDPHVWMDISLWSYIVDPITETLCTLDPAGAKVYQENAQSLKSRMQREHLAVQSALSMVPEDKRYLVTSHDAFNYFTRAYLSCGEKDQWKARFDAPEGLAPESQLSTADIQKIVEHLLRYQIKTVFPESNLSIDSLKKIIEVCHRFGHDVRISKEVLYGDAMGCKESGAENYFKMIHHDADVLIKEWQK